MSEQRVRKTLIAIAAVCLVVGPLARAGDWPNYRGPNYDGISDEVDWQANWGDAGPKVLWRASVGTGSSSVVIADGRAYTMGNHGEEEDQQEDTVYCFDAGTGELLWTHTYHCPLLPKYYEGGTLATPTVDGEVVYTLSKMGDLFCLQAETGQVLWEQQLNRELGFTLPTWHFSGSPLILDDRLILNVGSACVAFDKQTGALLWENGQDICGYSTPVPATLDGHECVVFCGADSIMGVQTADGELLWRYPFFNKHKATTADVIVHNNEVFASCAYDRGCTKIRIAEGQVTQVFDNTVIATFRVARCCGRDACTDLMNCGSSASISRTAASGGARKAWGRDRFRCCADGRMLIMSATSELVIAKVHPAEFEVIVRAHGPSRVRRAGRFPCCPMAGSTFEAPRATWLAWT